MNTIPLSPFSLVTLLLSVSLFFYVVQWCIFNLDPQVISSVGHLTFSSYLPANPPLLPPSLCSFPFYPSVTSQALYLSAHIPLLLLLQTKFKEHCLQLMFSPPVLLRSSPPSIYSAVLSIPPSYLFPYSPHLGHLSGFTISLVSIFCIPHNHKYAIWLVLPFLLSPILSYLLFPAEARFYTGLSTRLLRYISCILLPSSRLP